MKNIKIFLVISILVLFLDVVIYFIIRPTMQAFEPLNILWNGICVVIGIICSISICLCLIILKKRRNDI